MSGSESIGRYRWYILAVVLITYMLNTLDRILIAVLAEPIRLEFDMTDAQLGLLGGLIFAIAYSVAGIPAGMLVDKYSRVSVLAASVAIWSGFTFISGVTQSLATLALARIAVACAEAAVIPAAMSLISDYFPVKQRGTAISLLYLGSPLGMALGFTSGAFISQHFGWRTVFFAAGAPGLLLSAIFLLTVREPTRGGLDNAEIVVEKSPSFKAVIEEVLRNRPIFLLIAGVVFLAVAQSGLDAFLSSFFIRVHHLPLQQAGAALGLAKITGMASGVIVGGILADRLRRHSVYAGPWVSGAFLCAATPLAISGLLVEDWEVAIVLIALYNFFHAVYFGSILSTLMNLSPATMRGAIAGIMGVLAFIIGFGFGPMIVGGASDLFATLAIDIPLRWALIIISPFFAIGGLLFIAAGCRIRLDISKNGPGTGA